MTTKGWGVKPLKAGRVPASTIVVTAQAVLDGDPTGYSERWRCATARYARTGGRRKAKTEFREYRQPADLWADVIRHCGYDGLTFLWTYDLHWTARVAQMFLSLPQAGWTLEAFSMNPGAPWMVWRRNRATLKVVDAASLWPGGLDLVARLFSTARRTVDVGGATAVEWLWRSKQDCSILATAVDAYMGWVATDQLGPLSVTGNGQAWAAFRRRFYTHGILVHTDKEARAAERQAMWTGRCEAFWHGTLDRQVVHEWDFTCAYTNIAASHQLPTLLHGPLDAAKPLASYLDDDRFLVLAEVDVETSVPCVPAGGPDGILWPIGRFTTCLWEPEIRSVLGSGGTVRPRRGWLYRRSPALLAWGQWVLDQLASDDSVVPAWRKAIVKRWGNVLVGRFSMQYPLWTKEAWSPVSDVRCTPILDDDTGAEYLMMQVGHDVWRQTGVQDCHDSAPAITGYVMSVMRARLWELMQTLPAEALLYVDTDSLLVTDRWLTLMTALQAKPIGDGLRLKRSWDGMSIYGPRQVVTGDAVRVAGLPKRAQRTGRHEFAGETVEGLTEALGGGRLDQVRLTPAAWRIEGIDNRRTGPATGWTHPHRLDTWAPTPPPGKTG